MLLRDRGASMARYIHEYQPGRQAGPCRSCVQQCQKRPGRERLDGETVQGRTRQGQEADIQG
jgi:hypothetical protein